MTAHPTLAGECRERKILEGRLLADRKLYQSMLWALNEGLSREEFRDSYERAERARTAFEAARKALDPHLHAHRCGELV
jgi:hypothetical protein